MTNHSFDSAIAQQVGVNAAIIYSNICYWVEKNQANEKHFHDGSYWTYNSMKAFGSLFPYLTERQIRTAIQKLIDSNLIKTGNFNKSNYDRTMWYTSQIDLTLMSNGNDQNVEPIPNINTDKKPDNISSPEDDTIERVHNEYNSIIDELNPNWVKSQSLTKKRKTAIKKAISLCKTRAKAVNREPADYLIDLLSAMADHKEFFSGHPYGTKSGFRCAFETNFREQRITQAIDTFAG